MAQKSSRKGQLRSAATSVPRTQPNVVPTQTAPNPTLAAHTVVLPLRLFLAISFLAAGWDKLSDPQFFDSSATGYIGSQLSEYAKGSPLGSFLNSVAVPNATLLGGLVLVGELAIGLGTLVGLFSRTAAFFGFILSLTLWLTTSWQVSPFFLGSDLPFAMGWLVLLLAGAHPIYSLDGQWHKWQIQNGLSLLGRPFAWDTAGVADSGANQQLVSATTPVMTQLIARRRFIVVVGATVFAGGVTGLAWTKTLHDKSEGGISSPEAVTNPTAVPATASTDSPNVANPNPVSTSAAPTIKGGVVLAKLSSIAIGNAQKFTVPGTQQGAILIHEQDGSVKAFSTVCTHEGCEVDFFASAHILACPCHGARFDITTGNVTRGPARRPLASYNVQVDGSGNIVYVQS